MTFFLIEAETFCSYIYNTFYKYPGKDFGLNCSFRPNLSNLCDLETVHEVIWTRNNSPVHSSRVNRIVSYHFWIHLSYIWTNIKLLETSNFKTYRCFLIFKTNKPTYMKKFNYWIAAFDVQPVLEKTFFIYKEVGNYKNSKIIILITDKDHTDPLCNKMQLQINKRSD